MKYYNTIRQIVGGLFLAATFGLLPNIMAQQDSLVAMGVVTSAGTLTNSTNTVGGSISINDQGSGDHDIVIDAVGAFTGAALNDFVVEVMKDTTDTDNYVSARAITVTDDQLTVTVRAVDLEDTGNANAAAASDTPFYFVIRRISSSTIGTGTSHLIGLGRVNSAGGLTTGFGVDGITVSSSGLGGDYDITLEKTGAFIGDASSDYVVMAMVRGSGLDDEVAAVGTVSTGSDDNVSVNILTHDVQTAVASSGGTLAADDFFFLVYRIPSSPGNSAPQSKLLIGAANVSAAGALLEGATPLPGGVVTATDTAVGLYEVDINAAGAFAGKSSLRYIVHASIRESGLTDRVIQASASIINDNTLRISLATMDVEEDGEVTGALEDEDFSVVVYDAAASFQPDLRIGTKKNVTKMKGNNRINTNGAGQGIKVKLPGTAKKRFYFAVENDGTSTDDIKLREKGAGKILKVKFFSITGGRKNITAKVRTGAVAIPDLRPGQIARVEAQAKYSSRSKTPNRKLRITGTSLFDPAADTVKAKTVAQK